MNNFTNQEFVKYSSEVCPPKSGCFTFFFLLRTNTEATPIIVPPNIVPPTTSCPSIVNQVPATIKARVSKAPIA